MIFRNLYSLSLLLIRDNKFIVAGWHKVGGNFDGSIDVANISVVCEDTMHISGVLMRETNRIVRDTVVDEIAN